jgi:hypothetical protein
LILRHQYGDRFNAGRDRIAKGRRTIAQARELVGVALGAALSSLPEPLGTLLRLRSTLPPAGTAPVRAARDVRSATKGRAPDVASDEQEPASKLAAPSEPMIAQAPSTATEPSPISHPTVAHAPSAASEQNEHANAPVAPSPAVEAPIASPTSLAGPRTRTFFEEPIRTRSMARLLAAQGHRERALVIYEELLSRNSADAPLLAEATSVRRGEVVDAPGLPEPPPGLERATFPDAGDRLRFDGQPATGLLLHWRITDTGMRRARAVLGHDGELAIRVIAIRPDPHSVVRSEITEHGPVPPSGQWQAPALAGTARCLLALGLRDGERFVAIVHTHADAQQGGFDAGPRWVASA